jgi:methylenetetrahydrofolate reductase (NADPH)
MASGNSEAGRRMAAFMREWSLEATLPRAEEIEALKSVLAPGTTIFLSAIPAESHVHLIESSRTTRRAGFEPMPHIAARNYANEATLRDMLTRARGEADVRKVLVIGGDRETSEGPYTRALDVIETGLLQRHGIEAIGIGAYPEGHPRILDDELERALSAKLAAARRAGLGVEIVTQFGFDAERIVAWLRKLRGQGVSERVRIGLAGPAKVTTLLKFAQRCGVRASSHGLMRNVGLAFQALGRATPEEIVKSLAGAAASGELGAVAPHFYSFGGFLATAKWARGAEGVKTA